jgi:hypothetical protein
MRGQMKDPVSPNLSQQPEERLRIAEMGFVKLDLVEDVLEAPAVVPAADQQVDVDAVGEQAPNQVGADKAGAAGDERAFRRQDRTATIT